MSPTAFLAALRRCGGVSTRTGLLLTKNHVQIQAIFAGNRTCDGTRLFSSTDANGTGDPSADERARRSPQNQRLLRSKLGRQSPQSDGVWPPRRFGLRRNAVTVFPGDFGDIPGLKEGAERAWQKPKHTPQQEAEGRRETARKVQEIIKGRDAAKAELKKKWIETYKNPPQHLTKIDERGFSYGRGGRKRARARVWMTPGLGEITVNGKDFLDYFVRESLREDILQPFVVTDTCGVFDINASVEGGGLSGQAGAIRLGVARCLNSWNSAKYRPALKFKGFLTRDARIVEPKKIGLHKARKAPQWSKR